MQQGLIKNRSCQTNLIDFYARVMEFADKGTAAASVYLDSSKTAGIMMHNNLTESK